MASSGSKSSLPIMMSASNSSRKVYTWQDSQAKPNSSPYVGQIRAVHPESHRRILSPLSVDTSSKNIQSGDTSRVSYFTGSHNVHDSSPVGCVPQNQHSFHRSSECIPHNSTSTIISSSSPSSFLPKAGLSLPGTPCARDLFPSPNTLRVGEGPLSSTSSPSISFSPRESFQEKRQSVEEDGSPQKCSCNRSPQMILCRACGEMCRGRIRQHCELHRNQIFLMDLHCCPSCQSQNLKEIPMEDE